jgi:hypothetical protein
MDQTWWVRYSSWTNSFLNEFIYCALFAKVDMKVKTQILVMSNQSGDCTINVTALLDTDAGRSPLGFVRERLQSDRSHRSPGYRLSIVTLRKCKGMPFHYQPLIINYMISKCHYLLFMMIVYHRQL